MLRKISPGALRRIQRLLVILALICAAIALFYENSGQLLTWATDIECRLRGYDGCLCRDCQSHYLLIPHHDNWPRAQTALAHASWLMAALYALSALVVIPAVQRALRPRKRDPLKCPHCGYDLRGLTSPVCPECGAARPANPT